MTYLKTGEVYQDLERFAMKENSTRHLPDGSINFGNGVIGPSSADLEHANQVYEESLVSEVNSLAQDADYLSKRPLQRQRSTPLGVGE